MLATRIRGLIKQQAWAIGHYRNVRPVLDCLEEILTGWSFSQDVQVWVSPSGDRGCHLQVKTLVKIGSGVYPLILSETNESDMLAMTMNDITYLLVSVIEETEEELTKLEQAGAEILDPLSALLLETGQSHDTYLDIRE